MFQLCQDLMDTWKKQGPNCPIQRQQVSASKLEILGFSGR
jgi:hypothetical protein